MWGWLIPVAYLLGTFPSAVLVARASGVDIRSVGSGNPGASNVARVLGWRKGIWVFVLDAAKGALAAGLGLAVGISSGANFIGALIAQERLGSEAIVATVFSDDNKKYLSTDLVCEEPSMAGYISPDIEMFGYQTIGRIPQAAAISS